MVPALLKLPYKIMPKPSDDDYIVVFQMVKLSKHEAKKVGIGILFSLVGLIICLFIFGGKYKIISVIVVGIFLFIGYFLIGNYFVKYKANT
jgi:hypothetical protein